MSRRNMKRTTADPCEVRGCRSSSARYIISRNDVTRRVCQMCMLELVGLAGWSNDGVVGPSIHVRSAMLPTT
jgi:hypothetical protein